MSLGKEKALIGDGRDGKSSVALIDTLRILRLLAQDQAEHIYMCVKPGETSDRSGSGAFMK
jgi:hypothetical protein